MKIPETQKTQTYTHMLSDSGKQRVYNFLQLPAKTLKYHFSIDEKKYQMVKRYFKKIEENNFTISDKYKCKDSFRMFGVNTTLQSVNKNIRNILVKDDCYDIDIKNGAFSVAKYIINTHFNTKSSDFDLLIDYANNRDKYLTKKFDKEAWIRVLFNKNPNSLSNDSCYSKTTNALINQIHEFQTLAVENKDVFKIDSDFNANPSNINGSTMAKIYFHFENTILQKVIAKYADFIVAPIFDGVLVSKDCDIDTVLEGCNDIGKEFDIEFANKPFKTTPLYETIEKVLSNELVEASDPYPPMKKDFEEKHCMIKSPFCFVEHDDKGNYLRFCKGDFKDLTAPYYLTSDDGKRKPFVNLWVQDATRREYDTMNWIPSLDPKYNTANNFNTFQGFPSELVETPTDFKEQFTEVNDVYDGDAVLTFRKHISHIAGGSSEGSKYLTQYIAHMFQKPTILPLIALIFKSEEGSGKDLMTDVLRKVLGSKHVYKDSKMENIVGGTFNASIRNKLLVQINEVSGKDGHFNKELLKDLITVETLKIREMRTDIQEMPNYMRLFLCTNNMNAVNISPDDRRYVFFKSLPKKTKEYYDKLGSVLESKKAINSIYSFFMNYDISKFDIKKRYISEEYQRLKQHNQNPFYDYLNDFVIKQDNIPVKNGLSYVSVRQMDFGYKHWLDDNNQTTYEVSSKKNKLIFLECDSVKDAKFYEGHGDNKKQVRGYKYNADKLKTHLLKYAENVIECEDLDAE